MNGEGQIFDGDGSDKTLQLSDICYLFYELLQERLLIQAGGR